jgi:hypothetical protein
MSRMGNNIERWFYGKMNERSVPALIFRIVIVVSVMILLIGACIVGAMITGDIK